LLADVGIKADWNGVNSWFPDQTHPLDKKKTTIRRSPDGVSVTP